MKTLRRASVVAMGLLTIAAPSCPDALVITQAVKAATIAEIYITEDALRVELAIAVTDLPAFQNLLSNEPAFAERERYLRTVVEGDERALELAV